VQGYLHTYPSILLNLEVVPVDPTAHNLSSELSTRCGWFQKHVIYGKVISQVLRSLVQKYEHNLDISKNKVEELDKRLHLKIKKRFALLT
jgi:hypothetical protein